MKMKIGILGAGQLSQMLTLAAHPLGLKTLVFADNKEEPACQCAPFCTPSTSIANKINWKGLDLLTFESEFFSANKLKKDLKKFQGRIFPHLDALEMLQDRATQKEFLLASDLPTADFCRIQNAADLDWAFEYFEGQFVLKLRTHGYDGKGTFYARSKKERPALLAILQKYPQGFIAENRVAFRRELALMVFRSADGSIAHFPLVESLQKDSRCDLVLGPAQHPGLEPLLTKIKKALIKIDYVGAIAFELFDEGTRLSINEVAPRVHNSGHFSQNAINFDQFTLHLLCGLGEKLPHLRSLTPAYGMVNLIGTSTKTPTWSSRLETNLHWYNKSSNRVGRKMGHLNSTGPTTTQVRTQLLKDRKKFSI